MIGTLKHTLLHLPRRYKRLLQVMADILLVWFSIWIAFALRLGFGDSFAAVQAHAWLLWVAPLITIPTSVRFGMYRAVMRYLGKEALLEIVKSITTSALLLALALYLFGDKSDGVLPRSFVFNYWLVSLVDRKSTRLNSSHVRISYAVFCLKKKKKKY